LTAGGACGHTVNLASTHTAISKIFIEASARRKLPFRRATERRSLPAHVRTAGARPGAARPR
jgi:hypothetical protein